MRGDALGTWFWGERVTDTGVEEFYGLAESIIESSAYYTSELRAIRGYIHRTSTIIIRRGRWETGASSSHEGERTCPTPSDTHTNQSESADILYFAITADSKIP